jgi:DNA-binding MarR family transcriptional regulator
MPVTKSPLNLCLELSKAQSVMVRRLDGRLGALHGLSFGDFAILWHLSQATEGKLRRVHLAELVGLTPSAVTRTLIPLEKIGLVKREPDKHDARVGYALLTKVGERVLQEATESAEEASKEVLEMDAARFGALSEALARLV